MNNKGIKNCFKIFMVLLMIGYLVLNVFDNNNITLPILIPVIVTPLWCIAFSTFDKLDGDESSNKVFWYCFFGRIVIDIILVLINIKYILADPVLMLIALVVAVILSHIYKDKEGMEPLLKYKPILDDEEIDRIQRELDRIQCYVCLSCGAQFETDSQEINDTCPKCGSKSITKKELR